MYIKVCFRCTSNYYYDVHQKNIQTRVKIKSPGIDFKNSLQ